MYLFRPFSDGMVFYKFKLKNIDKRSVWMVRSAIWIVTPLNYINRPTTGMVRPTIEMVRPAIFDD